MMYYLLVIINSVIGWFSEWMERPAARGHIRSSSRFSRPGIRRMVFQLLSYSAMLSHSKKNSGRSLTFRCRKRFIQAGDERE
ncbi:MAG: hypothetical protein U0M99_04990 [Oscillospiraceae bacterium]|nr:hypothetical protein [Oscillibacter sp.]